MSHSLSDLERVAALAGVTINGPELTDPQILDPAAARTLLSGNSLAIGEAFMAKQWDVEDLAGLYTKLLESKAYEAVNFFKQPGLFSKAVLFNLQTRARAYEVGEVHYDLGNDLYEAMLDDRMVYTCAIWDGVDTLEAAQKQKLEAMCQKLDLRPGQRVLDIGCGWGSFMKYAAERYGVECVGLSVSKEQIAYGRTACADLPIEFVFADYREYADEQGFDHIVSIEMLEAVGPKNFRTYFETVHGLLRPGGRFALQTIGEAQARPVPDPWLDRYIFPNGVIPSLAQIEPAVRELFLFEHLDNIGPDYDPTLMAWWERFAAAYPELQARNPRYDEGFFRLWKYYLQSCAAVFRARQMHDWQIVFSLAP